MIYTAVILIVYLLLVIENNKRCTVHGIKINFIFSSFHVLQNADLCKVITEVFNVAKFYFE